MAIDIFCGLGGWAEGLLAAGWNVIGFDIERHDYGSGGYPAQLVIQNALTLHGSQFRGADLIVASPPCQEFSYLAMPWPRGKQIARALRGQGAFPEGYKGSRTIGEMTALFDACFRIQREACEAAGRYIPMVVENVKGAQPWVGPAKARYGSFFLWGDVEMIGDRVAAPLWTGKKTSVRPAAGQKFNPGGTNHGAGSWFAVADSKEPAVKVASMDGGRRTDIGKGARFTSRDCGIEGRKGGGDWFSSGDGMSIQRHHASNSPARKAASAQIAKIPFALAKWVGETYMPQVLA